MEAYFTKVQKACTPSRGKPLPVRKSDSQTEDTKSLKQKFEPNEATSAVYASTQEINKKLLETLADTNNPITHSDIPERSDRVISMAMGRQVAEGRPTARLLRQHHERMAIQRGGRGQGTSDKISDHPLSRTKVYLDGYLEATTDIEMKRVIIEAGGEVLNGPSRCTHIVTSQPLSASKTHKLLTTKSKIKQYVVKPEWVFDSVKARKRQSERQYVVNHHSSAKRMDKFVNGNV